MQLVVMTIRPGEDIGEEVHDSTDQFFRIEKGEGETSDRWRRFTRKKR